MGAVPVHGSPLQRAVLDGESEETAKALAVELLHRVAEVAADADVIYCLEPFPPILKALTRNQCKAWSLSNPSTIFLMDQQWRRRPSATFKVVLNPDRLSRDPILAMRNEVDQIFKIAGSMVRG